MTVPTVVGEADVVVIGSGWAGLAGAMHAAELGLSVSVLERSELFGGSSALSRGGTWYPGNPWQAEAGISDGPGPALEYLEATSTLGSVTVAHEYSRAYVDNCRRVFDSLESSGALAMDGAIAFPDYRMDLPGSRFGRTVAPRPFALADLGPVAQRLRRSTRPPIAFQDVATVGGFRSHAPAVTDEVARRREADVVTGGAAGVAALLAACTRHGVDLSHSRRTVRLTQGEPPAWTVGFEGPDGAGEIVATRGVLLASGGAEWSAELLGPNVTGPFAEPTTVRESDGDGHRMAARVGAPLAMMHDSHWVVSFRVRREDGSVGYESCTRERSGPRSIIVDGDGRRFVNEALPYNDLVAGSVRRWDAARYRHPHSPMYLVVDGGFLARYPVAGHDGRERLPEGARTAPTLGELAEACGIDAEGLEETVEDFNRSARAGEDPVFGRGGGPYERFNGDNDHEPNPCLGPLDQSPYAAIPLHVSTLGHKGGVLTDGRARVLDVDGTPIPGLHAAGNVTAALMHGPGYTGGAMLGRCLIFGFLAAEAMAGPAD